MKSADSSRTPAQAAVFADTSSPFSAGSAASASSCSSSADKTLDTCSPLLVALLSSVDRLHAKASESSFHATGSEKNSGNERQPRETQVEDDIELLEARHACLQANYGRASNLMVPSRSTLRCLLRRWRCDVCSAFNNPRGTQCSETSCGAARRVLWSCPTCATANGFNAETALAPGRELLAIERGVRHHRDHFRSREESKMSTGIAKLRSRLDLWELNWAELLTCEACTQRFAIEQVSFSYVDDAPAEQAGVVAQIAPATFVGCSASSVPPMAAADYLAYKGFALSEDSPAAAASASAAPVSSTPLPDTSTSLPSCCRLRELCGTANSSSQDSVADFADASEEVSLSERLFARVEALKKAAFSAERTRAQFERELKRAVLDDDESKLPNDVRGWTCLLCARMNPAAATRCAYSSCFAERYRAWHCSCGTLNRLRGDALSDLEHALPNPGCDSQGAIDPDARLQRVLLSSLQQALTDWVARRDSILRCGTCPKLAALQALQLVYHNDVPHLRRAWRAELCAERDKEQAAVAAKQQRSQVARDGYLETGALELVHSTDPNAYRQPQVSASEANNENAASTLSVAGALEARARNVGEAEAVAFIAQQLATGTVKAGAVDFDGRGVLVHAAELGSRVAIRALPVLYTFAGDPCDARGRIALDSYDQLSPCAIFALIAITEVERTAIKAFFTLVYSRSEHLLHRLTLGRARKAAAPLLARIAAFLVRMTSHELRRIEKRAAPLLKHDA